LPGIKRTTRFCFVLLTRIEKVTLAYGVEQNCQKDSLKKIINLNTQVGLK